MDGAEETGEDGIDVLGQEGISIVRGAFKRKTAQPHLERRPVDFEELPPLEFERLPLVYGTLQIVARPRAEIL